ncbi:MAG: AI-2E family transporter [Phycisphaerales bacterium]
MSHDTKGPQDGSRAEGVDAGGGAVPAAGSGGGSGIGDWRRIRLWQIQPVRDLLVLAFVLGLVWLGYVLRTVTVPLLLAMALAYLVEPVVARVTRAGRIRRPLAAVLVIVIAALAVVTPVVVGSGFAVAQGARVADGLSRNFGRFTDSVRTPDDEQLRERVPIGAWRKMRDFLVDLQKRHPELALSRPPDSDGGTTSPAPTVPPVPTPDEPAPIDAGGLPDAEPTAAERWADWSYDWLQENMPQVRRWLTGSLIGSGRDAFSALWGFLLSTFYLGFTLFLTLFFFFFICTAWSGVKEHLASLIPESSRDRMIDIVWKMDRVIAAFIRGRLLISAILIVLFTVGFWLIGVPAPLVVGVIVGVLSLVPYLALLGVPVAIVLMWLNPSGVEWQTTWWWVIGAPSVLYWIVQATDDYIWTPLIQGKATGMDTPTILFAVLAGGTLAGFYGVMVSIPVAACVKILLKEIFWPRFEAWAKGQSRDFLPISRA